MVNLFEEVIRNYSEHPLNKKVKYVLESKNLNEIIRAKDKTREIIKEMSSGGIMDKDDKEFLLENVILLSNSSCILQNSFSSLLTKQESKLLNIIPSGFNLSVLLHHIRF